MRHVHYRLVLLCLGVLASCSSDAQNQPLGPGFNISISNMNFTPLNLAVPPGATVTVTNNDGYLHSITSESAAETYTPGGVAGVSFDTGQFTTTGSFTIPANAPDGTVIPYYCAVHQGMMITKTGTITVKAAALPPPRVDGGVDSGVYVPPYNPPPYPKH